MWLRPPTPSHVDAPTHTLASLAKDFAEIGVFATHLCPQGGTMRFVERSDGLRTTAGSNAELNSGEAPDEAIRTTKQVRIAKVVEVMRKRRILRRHGQKENMPDIGQKGWSWCPRCGYGMSRVCTHCGYVPTSAP